MLLDVGRNAARQLDRWDDALDLNAAILASKHDRNAPAADIAQTRFNDYSPLLQLDRADEALALLRECRQIFQDANDVRLLGMTLTALASVENARGHSDAAIRMEHDALRYKYMAGIMTSIAGSYHNLGDYLRSAARQAARPWLATLPPPSSVSSPVSRVPMIRSVPPRLTSARPVAPLPRRRIWRTCAASSVTSPAPTSPACSRPSPPTRLPPSGPLAN
jgi:hypothetical protein